MNKIDNRDQTTQAQPKKKLVLNAETLKLLRQVSSEDPEGWLRPTDPPGC